MKLRSGFWFAKCLVLALGLVAVVPATSYAETARGKFTLDSETHWGTAVLPAGDYEFSIDPSLSPTRVVVRRMSGEPAAIVVAVWTSAADSSAANSLHLESRGQDVFVSSLILTDAELHFVVPKAKEVLVQQTAKVRLPAASGSAQ
jgi:hypothetical protein